MAHMIHPPIVCLLSTKKEKKEEKKKNKDLCTAPRFSVHRLAAHGFNV